MSVIIISKIIPTKVCPEYTITINLIWYQDMLIHLEGKVHNDVINFDLPQLYFRQGQTVAVAEIGIDWCKTGRFSGEITTSLVDKSPCNPKQQIYHINKASGSNYTFDTPTHFLEYKIQCLDLNASVFKINIYDKDKKKIKNSIKGVYLTLIISDAGLQYINPRKAN